MKYSKTTLMELSHKYRSILKKCAYLNMIAVLGIAGAASATTVIEPAETTGNIVSTINSETTGIGDNDVLIRGVKELYTVDGVKLTIAGTEEERLNVKGVVKGLTYPFDGDDRTTTSLIDGDLDITLSNVDLTTGVYGNEFQLNTNVYHDGKPRMGTSGKTTITLENSTVQKDIRASNAGDQGYSYGLNDDTEEKLRAVTKLGDVEFNINDSTVGTEVVVSGGYLSAGNVKINVRGQSSIGQEGDDEGWILAGPNNKWATVDSTEINLMPGENNEINIAGVIHAGARDRDKGNPSSNKSGHVTGDATLNMFGGGTVNVGYNLRAYNVAGTRTLNIDNVVANIGGDIAPEFDTINLGEGAKLNVDGAFNVAENATVNIAELDIPKLSNSTIISAGSVVVGEGAKLGQLTVTNGTEGEYTFIESSNWTGDFTADDISNTLYDIKYKEKGVLSITKKSSEDVIKDLVNEGATAQEAATISAVAGSTSDSPVLNAITEAVQNGEVGKAAQAAKDLAPTTSYQVVGVTKEVNNLLSNVAASRMAAVGKAGGDAFVGGGVWVQGLYNHSKQDKNSKTDGFKANSRGIAFGVDGKVNDAMTVGIGYGYTNTDAKAGGHDIDVDGNNIFAYAQYQPNAWYVNGMLNYGFAKYTEKKSPMGVGMKTKYDVNSYAANLMTGYDFESGFTPTVGMRYLLVDQKDYNDGLQHVKSENSEVVTGVVGLKYATNIKTEDWMFKPTLSLAATYDVKSDSAQANVNVIGGGNYQIAGEHLHRFGTEAGVGLDATYGDWDLSVNYNGGFRKDFQSHTGIVKAKYNF